MTKENLIKESRENNLGIAAFFLALGFMLIVLLPFASAARIIGFEQIQFGEDLSINSSTLNILTKNTSRMYVTNAGLVGIGTLGPESMLHINVSDTTNKSVTNLITLDHVLANPENSTGGIGLGMLFRAVNNDSEMVNVSFINATLVNAVNGSEASALSLYTRSGQGGLVPKLVLNGTDVFIAPTAGKVGIGTETPSHTLTVVGSLNVTGVSYLGDVTISADNITTNEIVSRDGNISFFNDTRDELVRITSVGSIGIGTKLPDTKLKVAGDINITGTIWSQGINVTDEHGWLDIGSVVHTIASDDFVGIGTTTPSEKLQVAGNGSFDGDLVVRGNLLSTGGSGSGAAIIGWIDEGTTVRLNTATDLVGIGTSSPDSKLHIYVSDNSNTSVTNLLTLEHNLTNAENSTGGIGVGILFRAVNNDSEMVNVSFINASLVNAINGSEFSALTFYTLNGTGGSQGRLIPSLTINGSKVGIGTSSPDTALDVIGTVTATSFSGDGSSLTGITTSTSVWNSSGTNVFLNDTTASVGIGTASPNYKLDVAGTINASGLRIDGDINVTRTIFYGGNLTGYGADYAEMFEKLNPSERIGAGDIVAIVKGKVTKTSADASLHMVVTDSAALIGNRGNGEIPVAFVGQVKTKVSGLVQEGDYILASLDNVGYAKSKKDVSFEEFKSKVVGIALEGKDKEGVKRINVAVGVK